MSWTTSNASGTAPAEPDPLLAAVRAAQVCQDLLAELQALYAELPPPRDAACARCGRCCDFDAFGHRLYASSAELALLTLAAPGSPRPRAGGCPYQQGRLCTAREGRTLGCRLFFCREAAGDDRADLYEALHRRICRLHERHCIPYVYADLAAFLPQWLAAKQVT